MCSARRVRTGPYCSILAASVPPPGEPCWSVDQGLGCTYNDVYGDTTDVEPMIKCNKLHIDHEFEEHSRGLDVLKNAGPDIVVVGDEKKNATTPHSQGFQVSRTLPGSELSEFLVPFCENSNLILADSQQLAFEANQHCTCQCQGYLSHIFGII